MEDTTVLAPELINTISYIPMMSSVKALGVENLFLSYKTPSGKHVIRGEATFNTCIWHNMRTYTNRGDIIFPIGQRRMWKAELELKNARYTIFSQPKIECSKLFKLKTDGDTT